MNHLKTKDVASFFIRGENILIILIGLFSVMQLLLFADYPLEARRFPQLIASVAIVLCATLLGTGFWQHIKKIAADMKNGSEQACSLADGGSAEKTENAKNKYQIGEHKWIGVLMLCIAHSLIAGHLGYVITSTLLLVAMPLYLGYRRFWIILIIAVLISGGSYIVFRDAFHVPLPRLFWLF